MEKINLPNTELITSKLGFGTASLHHIANNAGRLNLLSKAYELGFTHYDTARMYGEGMAERTLGTFLQNGMRNNITIASKLGLTSNPLYEQFPSLMYGQKIFSNIARRMGVKLEEKERKYALSINDAESSFSKTLNALKTDWLDILFIHEPQFQHIEMLEKLAPWLEKQKQSGRVRYLGLSGNASICVKILKELPELFDVLQVEDSIEKQEADALLKEHLALQITFGYLRQTNQKDRIEVFKKSLQRNKEGMILVSSKNIDHLSKLVKIVDQETK